jgi:hypothetical protein
LTKVPNTSNATALIAIEPPAPMKLSVGRPDRDAQPVCDGILAVKVRQLDCSPGLRARMGGRSTS